MVVYESLNKPELYHHGILNMKWGIRRYQNKDGTLTPAGKERYRKLTDREYNKDAMSAAKLRKAEEKRLTREEEYRAEQQKKLATADNDADKLSVSSVKRQISTEEKDDIINSGSVKRIYDNRDSLSTAEIKMALDRADTIRRAKEQMDRESLAADAETRDKAMRSVTAKELYENKDKYSSKEIQDALTRFDNEKKLRNLSEEDVKSGVQRIAEIGEAAMKVRTASENFINLYNTVAKVRNSLSSKDPLPIIGEKRDKKNSEIAKIIKSGNIDDILANKTKMTTQELEEAVNRVSKERRLMTYAEASNKKDTVSTRNENSKSSEADTSSKKDSSSAKETIAEMNEHMKNWRSEHGISENSKTTSKYEERATREREKADAMNNQYKEETAARKAAEKAARDTIDEMNKHMDEYHEKSIASTVDDLIDVVSSQGYIDWSKRR